MTEIQNMKYPTPNESTLEHSARIAIIEDKPVMYDYWTSSCDKNIFFGIRTDGEKLLVKNVDEYTSPIEKIFKIEEDYIIITNNSIYLTKADIPQKNISG